MIKLVEKNEGDYHHWNLGHQDQINLQIQEQHHNVFQLMQRDDG